MLRIFLWISISLFILHEMDAVYRREWKMMKFIGNLNDNTGHVVFTASHFFLFMIIFYFSEFHINIFFPVISILMIIHQFVHLIFRKHHENRMGNIFSQLIIFLLFLNSVTGIIFFFNFF